MTEAQRIAALPKRFLETEPDLTRRFAKNPKGKLRPIQSRALYELSTTGGLFGAMSCGSGKTLTALLAGEALGVQRTVILVPSSVASQFHEMAADARREWKTGQEIHIVTYSMLSRKKTRDVLTDLKPDLIVADEAHKLKNLKSTRTIRLMRYLEENPETKFVALSGSFTSRSLNEYWHLMAFCLREASPLPVSRTDATAWARVLDYRADPFPNDWRLFKALPEFLDYPRIETQKQARRFYRLHLTTSPGVVLSPERTVGASLRIHRVKSIHYPDDIYAKCIESDEDPGGRPFERDLDKWACLRQLSLGFYYVWDWGDREPDDEWVRTRRRWGRAVRLLLDEHAQKGFDSRLLVEEAIMYQSGIVPIGTDALQRFHAWMSVKHREGPETVPVWVDDRPLKAVIEHVKKQGGPWILWYHSEAVAHRLVELGIDVVFAGNEPRRDGKKTVALSIRSHSTGWNLQEYHQNFIIEPPGNADAWEQLLARTHREGQEADEVLFHVLQHTPVFYKSLKQSREQARDYVEETTGLTQRLGYADYGVDL